jgi:hypothetical protein
MEGPNRTAKYVDDVTPKTECLKESTYNIHCAYIITDLCITQNSDLHKIRLAYISRQRNPYISQGGAVMCTGV